MKSFILGTRGSALALAQAALVKEALCEAESGRTVEIRVIRTLGDDRLDIDLANPGGLDKGLFTKQLEEALLKKEIDAAVHSLKDLPVDLPPGLVLGAIPRRADPQDVLVSMHSGGLRDLPEGACVATSSVRRQQLLGLLRPDLQTVPIRGNVPTRLRKLSEDPSLDALVLAKAGLDRLGATMPTGFFAVPEPDLLPAPGQGALGIEIREGDSEVLKALAPLHCSETARCVNSERALLKALGGGCEIPLGALATLRKGQVVLRSIYFGEPGIPQY